MPTGVRKVDVIGSLGPTISSFSSTWDSKVEAVELVASTRQARRKTGKGVCIEHLNTVCSCFCNRVKLTISLLQRCYYRSPVTLYQ